MLEINSTESITDQAAKTLGSANSYAVFTDKFDPTQLNFMARAAARADYGITGEEFDGFDIWHCYEATFLLDSGQPIAGTLKVKFPITNKDMCESKSFKLYLNTFDMCRMGPTFVDAIRNYENQIKKDMNDGGLKCEVRFFSVHVLAQSMINPEAHPLRHARLLQVNPDIAFTDFTGESSHIVKRGGAAHSLLYTNTLRSRCRHTKQKDSGSAFISLQGTGSDIEILKQIVSLREVNEFHEFCAEKLFVELDKSFTNVGIYLLYSRRGSLDIHPVRFKKNLPSSHASVSLAVRLGSMKYLHNPIFGQ
jgi:7-cyano-7-deazaguanine reductase